MAFFPETIAAQLAGSVVRADLLVSFEFRSVTRRLWNGFAALRAGGEMWDGVGGLGRITGLQQPVGTVAPEISFSVSGAEEDGIDGNFVKLAAGAVDEFYRRPVSVYLQFFSADWSPLDNPYVLQRLLMGSLEVERSTGNDGAPIRTVTISTETINYKRGRPAYSYWSDRDQQALFPGDKAMERMALLLHHTVKWPDF